MPNSMKVELEFFEPLLGTSPANPELAKDYVISKLQKNHPEADFPQDEVDALLSPESVFEKAATIFNKENGAPYLLDYQMKGFFKEACYAMINGDDHTKVELSKVRLTEYLHRKTIHQQISVAPRRIFLDLHGGVLTSFQRPLRGTTPRGERICLAHSEMAPVGTTCQFAITWYSKVLRDYILEWLDMGERLGTMQFRSGGYGRFNYRILPKS